MAGLVLETFIDRAIRCTNIHGQRDAKFLDLMNKTFGENKIPCNDKGINFFKRFFALKFVCWPYGYKKYARSLVQQKDPLKACP